MIRVIIADDHAVIRRGIREILDETDAVRVVDEAADGRDLLEKVLRNRYDVVLLDINMPGRNGLDVLKDIKHLHPDQKVVILSMYPEEEYAIRALRTGAAGYVRKDSSPETIVHAITVVHAGKKYVNEEIYDSIIDELRNPEDADPHRKLSNREMEIFLLIGQGRALSEISESLTLSPKTVSTYRARIMEKMKMKNNADIIKYVVARGLH